MTMQASGTDGFTFPDNTTQKTAFAPGMRNKIINGAMMIDQRNAGASVTATTAFPYTVDRWQCGGSQNSKFTVQQSSTAPVGFTSSALITSSSAYTVGSSEYFLFQQPIEGNNCADLAWGTANAKAITVSFWVRSSITGTFGGAINNSASDRTYPFSYSISVANTWEQKTISVAGDTTGTWLTNTSIGLQIRFSLGAGSTYSTTAGSWAAGFYASATGAVSVVGTSGATWYVTGVQLEKGATATPFENRLYGTELALCMRYYFKTEDNGSYVVNSASVYTPYQWKARMRATPTVTVTPTSGSVTVGTLGTDGFHATGSVTAGASVIGSAEL